MQFHVSAFQAYHTILHQLRPAMHKIIIQPALVVKGLETPDLDHYELVNKDFLV